MSQEDIISPLLGTDLLMGRSVDRSLPVAREEMGLFDKIDKNS
jgi:hypothetical protein